MTTAELQKKMAQAQVKRQGDSGTFGSQSTMNAIAIARNKAKKLKK